MTAGEHTTLETLDSFRELYRSGELDDRTVELDLPGESPKNRLNIEQGLIMIDNLMDKKPMGKRGSKKIKVCYVFQLVPFFLFHPYARGMGCTNRAGCVLPEGAFCLSWLAVCTSACILWRLLQVSEARARIEELEADKHLSSDAVTKEALRATEQDG